MRSLNSPVLKWSDARAVDTAVREWVARAAEAHAGVLRIGYFGSYARGNWGVGSDVDIVVIVEASGDPFEARAADWDITGLPVPADVFVYTHEEWETATRRASFHSRVEREAVWLAGARD